MRARLLSLSVAVVFAVSGAVALATAPNALGVFTFSRITTPSKDLLFKYNQAKTPAQNSFIVSGSASNDISTVNIVCMFTAGGRLQDENLALNVPVTGGSFSTVASFDDPDGLMPTCRMRAVPTTVDPLAAYLGAFSGPILFTSGVILNKAGPTIYGFTGISAQGTDFGETTSAGECSVAATATFVLPQVELLGTNQPACSFGLPGTNATLSGTPTGSALRVDGHNVYLPAVVQGYLNKSPLSLGLPIPALSVSLTRPNTKGDIVITESTPLKRCSVSDVFPPTLVSCPALVNTGVTFKRVTNVFARAHQIRVRDSYIGNGSAHAISASYTSAMSPPDAGATGYIFPGHGATLQTAHSGETVTGLGTKANTLVVRSDKFASIDEPTAETWALTWSRAPQKIQFDGTQSNLFAMPYSLHTAANGTARIGFAFSGRLLTADAVNLAKLGVADMIGAPKITSPANGATIHGKSTTVKGSVGLGANGLPSSVTVAGHAATLHVNAAKTSATFAVTFSESFGTHKIVVTAKDSAGNTASRSITVKNVA